MNLIKIKEEHYVIVDDSKTKEGDFIADFRLDCRILISKWNEEDSIDGFFFDAKKITHSTQPLEPIVTDNSFKNYEFISLQEVKEIISEMPNGNKIDSMAEKHNFGELECQTIDNRTPCDCNCHREPNTIHFMACCNDGMIGEVITKLKLKT